MAKKKLHMIGNAHLDPVWLWNWQEGFQENKATFKSALDRLDEFDDVIFTSSSAQFYRWIEENNPDMFEKIRKRIQEGRWIICGGWWIQPDCNIPSGESFARHALLSQNYFYEKFGVMANTGYCVDSFGHNGMLPQLLQKSHMDNYVFMRPGPHEKKLNTHTFIWESPDGSRVKAFRIPFTYGEFKAMPEHIERCIKEFDPGIDHLMCFYGVGNHGGGPTVKNIQTIHEEMKKHDDVEIVFSSPNEFFADVEKDGCRLPVVKDDLQHHSAGCYSAESMIKAMNRRTENALLAAEKYSVLCMKLGESGYPSDLDHAWERLLFNQFHDILAGSSIDSAYYDARNDLGEALSIAERDENNAIQAISFAIGIPHDENTLPLVVFNPHSWEVTSCVEFETGLFGNGMQLDGIKVVDSEGLEAAHQIVDAVCRVPNRRRIAFEATVPGLGYQVYKIVRGESAETVPEAGAKNILENELIRVELDPDTGNIRSIQNKATGREYLCAETQAAVMTDDSDTWGHDITKIDKQEGSFTLCRIRKFEEGSVRSSIQVTSKYGSSTMTQVYTLYHGDRQIYIQTTLNWLEHRKCLKFNFPVRITDYTACCEIPFGNITKECNGWEEPIQRWADLSNKEYGLSILNDGKYSADFHESTISMTALRSPVYAHHNPYVLREDEEYRYMDQGIQKFTYVILPHEGDWRSAGTVRKATLLNQPLLLIPETYHDGNLPQKQGFLKISAPNILLSALKKARSSDDIVLRIYETDGKLTDAVLEIFNTVIHTALKPYEIKTFALKKDGSFREIDLIEWDLS